MKKIVVRIFGQPAEVTFAARAPAWVGKKNRRKTGVQFWDARNGWKIYIWNKQTPEMMGVTIRHEFVHCIDDARRWFVPDRYHDELWCEAVGDVMYTAESVIKEYRRINEF